MKIQGYLVYGPTFDYVPVPSSLGEHYTDFYQLLTDLNDLIERGKTDPSLTLIGYLLSPIDN